MCAREQALAAHTVPLCALLSLYSQAKREDAEQRAWAKEAEYERQLSRERDAHEVSLPWTEGNRISQCCPSCLQAATERAQRDFVKCTATLRESADAARKTTETAQAPATCYLYIEVGCSRELVIGSSGGHGAAREQGEVSGATLSHVLPPLTKSIRRSVPCAWLEDTVQRYSSGAHACYVLNIMHRALYAGCEASQRVSSNEASPDNHKQTQSTEPSISHQVTQSDACTHINALIACDVFVLVVRRWASRTAEVSPPPSQTDISTMRCPVIYPHLHLP